MVPARFAGRSVKAAVIIRSPADPVRKMNKKPGRTHVAARCVNQSFLAKRMPIVRAAVSVYAVACVVRISVNKKMSHNVVQAPLLYLFVR